MVRPHLPESVETLVLTRSRRRCCICFGLEGDFSQKRGQIAHLDRDPANNAFENLAFLCLDHHDEYDSRTSQSKGLREKEAKVHREALYAGVARYLCSNLPAVSTSEDLTNMETEDPFLARGELDFYFAQFVGYRDRGVVAAEEIGRSIETLNVANEKSAEMSRAVVAAPPGGNRLQEIHSIYRLMAADLVRFSEEHSAGTARFGVATSKMLNALSRAYVIFSDVEGATPEMLLPKINELRSVRQRFVGLIDRADRVKAALMDRPRGPTDLNRGRRLAVGALDQFVSEVTKKIQEIDHHNDRLEQLLMLM